MTELDPARTVAGSILGTKWKPRLIVVLASEGKLGFGDLQRELDGISNKVLADDLEGLRDRGVVTRDVIHEQPRRVEYELTAAGRELYTILESMATWDASYVTGGGLPTVLLADDDQRLLELYSIWLSADYDVITATDGREALLGLDDAVDVAILDRAMPGLRGEEVAAAVEAADQRTGIALLTSSEVSPSDVLLPADRLVRKPITHDELDDLTEALCRLTDLSPSARDVRARRHRLDFVETHLGAAVTETDPYRRASDELEEIEADRRGALEARDPWRRLLEADPDEPASAHSED